MEVMTKCVQKGQFCHTHRRMVPANSLLPVGRAQHKITVPTSSWYCDETVTKLRVTFVFESHCSLQVLTYCDSKGKYANCDRNL